MFFNSCKINYYVCLVILYYLKLFYCKSLQPFNTFSFFYKIIINAQNSYNIVLDIIVLKFEHFINQKPYFLSIVLTIEY